MKDQANSCDKPNIGANVQNSVAPGREALYREYEDLESGN
ncbi:hypothetical protein C5167_006529 [Papaver somniferum]|uniref:Uncharacterized protein n=1 Tax=Papaver somniferum TaxID=3469 RepID=A0A4Y7JFC6_PAPSO|nr:hypothetical protein C5167_006529 [Papaver somniferum]